jgi:DNA polymerase elongation subunit (family B)
MGIEERTTDLATLYVTSYKNATPYEQVFKQTLKLRNVQYRNYSQNGLVPGNNINVFQKPNNQVLSEEEEDDDDGFEGALVGNPLLNDYFGMDLYGQPSNSVFNYSIDMDMSSFYPNTIYTMNIDPSTLYFKCICDAKQFEPRGGEMKYHGYTDQQEVPTNSDSFEGDIGKEIFDNFQTRNWISIGHKWTNLPSVSELYEECMKELAA